MAVVAHAGKSLGGGLPELRQVLEQAGHPSPGWYEVAKSKQAPECVRRAIDEGADLVFVWGGDGTVQRCIDVLAGSGTALAVIPAGTANLLARNLGIPLDIAEAVVDRTPRSPQGDRHRDGERRALRRHGRGRARRAHDR